MSDCISNDTLFHFCQQLNLFLFTLKHLVYLPTLVVKVRYNGVLFGERGKR